MTRALLRAQFTQPSPHIFLHFCITHFTALIVIIHNVAAESIMLRHKWFSMKCAVAIIVPDRPLVLLPTKWACKFNSEGFIPYRIFAKGASRRQPRKRLSQPPPQPFAKMTSQLFPLMTVAGGAAEEGKNQEEGVPLYPNGLLLCHVGGRSGRLNQHRS